MAPKYFVLAHLGVKYLYTYFPYHRCYSAKILTSSIIIYRKHVAKSILKHEVTGSGVREVDEKVTLETLSESAEIKKIRNLSKNDYKFIPGSNL